MVEAGVNLLGRVSSKRVFYLPPPPYSGFGSPRLRGRKIRLKEEPTLPDADHFEPVELEGGGRIEISRWDDLRMRKWPQQPLVLRRVWEYSSHGKKPYARPLWLIYLGRSLPPQPAQAEAIYDLRFGIEDSLSFMKRELTLDKAQFNGEQPHKRVALWVEIVASVLWMLFALRAVAKSEEVSWPKWWPARVLTPGAVGRVALGLLVKLGISQAKPQVRGKSPGRAKGRRMEPRKR